ncbi:MULTISPECIES: BfmA/BtgA family mobilization protein [unclassified Myroides]|uniref:BfmA/BtgA family mobilization protein n=1 Tax=unclassified Myroides TaxID=2642485 RepID=UPI0031019DDE
MQDFKDTSIRIKGSTKNKLDKLCKEYQYKKINDCVVAMIDFFIQNGLSPQSNINLNLEASLDKINKDFIKRDDSFRKWFGDLYYKKVVFLMKQSEDIFDQNNKILNLIEDKFKREIMEALKEDNISFSDNSEEWKQKYFKVLDDKEEELIEEKETVRFLKNKLKSLIEKVERKSSFSNSYIIRLTQEELREFQGS